MWSTHNRVVYYGASPVVDLSTVHVYYCTRYMVMHIPTTPIV